MNTKHPPLVVALLFATAGAIHAADVTWGPPTNISGPSDIITTGTLVAAVNGSTSGDIVVDPGGLNMTFTPDNTWFPTQNPFNTGFAPSSGDAGFDAVMNTADWGNTPEQGTVVNIPGLTIGQPYAIQMFIADTRGCCNGRSMEITGGANTATLFMGNNAGNPDPAQFVIGKFTADATTQGFAFTGTHPTAGNLRHPQLNAYVLRTDPAVITMFTGDIDDDIGMDGNWDEGLPTNDGNQPGIVPDGFPALSGSPGDKQITFQGASGYDGDGFSDAPAPYDVTFNGTGDSNFSSDGIDMGAGSILRWNSTGTATTRGISIGGQLTISAGMFISSDNNEEFDIVGGGTLTISGGLLDLQDDINVNNGSVSQTGGDVTSANGFLLLPENVPPMTSATWTISGGSVQAQGIEFDTEPGSGFHFTSGSTGALRILNSAQSVAAMEALIANGDITTDDPLGLEVGTVDVGGTAYSEVRVATLGAAAVTWDDSQNVTGPADIITDGQLIAAVNADNGGDVVVDPGGLNMTFTPDNTMFPSQNPFTTSFAPSSGDAGFDAIMNRADWDGTNPNATDVVVGGLDVGQQYAIQMFVSDTRTCCNTRSMEITGGGNTATVFMGDVGGAPNPAQYMIGRFTAEKPNQVFTFTGTHASAGNLRHPQLNAYVLRTDVPAIPFVFTDVVYDQGAGQFTLTWNSEPGKIYGLFWSTDMQSWDNDIDDGIDSEGTSTTWGPFDHPLPGLPEIYFRVEDGG